MREQKLKKLISYIANRQIKYDRLLHGISPEGVNQLFDVVRKRIISKGYLTKGGKGCGEAEIQSEEQIVYLVAIIEKNTEYEDVKNYLFQQRKDAINLIEKDYYLKPVKNSPRKWQNTEDDINAVLAELFIRRGDRIPT